MIPRNSVGLDFFDSRSAGNDDVYFADVGNITATVKAIFHNKNFIESTTVIPEGTSFGVLLDRTSFYAESGGQEYDTGNIVIDGVADFEVANVQIYNGYVLHIGHLKYGQLEIGNEIISSYDEVCCNFPPLS